MRSSVEQFLSYLREGTAIRSHEDFDSLLEMLCRYYTEFYPAENESISEAYASILPLIQPLSHKRERRLLFIIGRRCQEHERAAFQEGVRVGAQLTMEFALGSEGESTALWRKNVIPGFGSRPPG